jgi:hypothetical protein
MKRDYINTNYCAVDITDNCIVNKLHKYCYLIIPIIENTVNKSLPQIFLLETDTDVRKSPEIQQKIKRYIETKSPNGLCVSYPVPEMITAIMASVLHKEGLKQ